MAAVSPPPTTAPEATYSRFACIGAGVSAIGLGATLQRWYGITDVRFFERRPGCGGTWLANGYPGAACDIPSALYSLSFESNPDWSRILPPSAELRAYLARVADKYGLLGRMTFGTDVERCEWVGLEGREGEKGGESGGRWRLRLKDLETGRVFYHECQFLFSGAGQLVTPRKLDIPGADSFKGTIIHSSQWRHPDQQPPNSSSGGIDLQDKNVIVIGNGCTGSQIVPSIAPTVSHLTHITRSRHWVVPPADGAVVPLMRFMLRWIPGAMLLQRLIIYFIAERETKGYPLTKAGQRFRDGRRERYERYMRRTAPEKYHGLLIPEFEVNCKRRIFDSGYLACLHRENVTLTDDKALEVVPEGIRTANGVIAADVIILANGFQTNDPLHGVEVVGRGGQTLEQHWKSLGGVGAYNCTVLSGFPNFFMLLGPNTLNGHSSAIIASENSVNYALRLIRPLLNDEHNATVEVRRDAEDEYVNRIQAGLRNMVWSTGCGNWYMRAVKGGDEENTKWNGMTYPWSQAYFWYQCLFPTWKHLTYSGASTSRWQNGYSSTSTALVVTGGAIAASILAWKSKAISK